MFLNGERLPIKSFVDYVDMYLGPKESGVPRVYERVGQRWEVCISATEGQFQQVTIEAQRPPLACGGTAEACLCLHALPAHADATWWTPHGCMAAGVMWGLWG